jgi:hypothetical protein
MGLTRNEEERWMEYVRIDSSLITFAREAMHSEILVSNWSPPYGASARFAGRWIQGRR